MRRGLIVTCLLLWTLWPVQSRAQPSRPSAASISVTAHGVRLTVSVPAQVFPRDALIRFPVRVENISRHTVFARLGPQCSDTNPSIEVLNTAGQPTSQWPRGMVPHPCPMMRGQPFEPGQVWTGHALAVVNGTALRATLTLGTVPTGRIQTRTVRLGVAGSTPPAVTIGQSSRGAFATVSRPAGVRGPLYVMDSTMCDLENGTSSLDSSMLWYPVKGNRAYSGCLGPQEWHGWAGYVGYPVATISYTSP